MFERFAAKGPGLILGLMAALLPASGVLAKNTTAVPKQTVDSRTVLKVLLKQRATSATTDPAAKAAGAAADAKKDAKDGASAKQPAWPTAATRPNAARNNFPVPRSSGPITVQPRSAPRGVSIAPPVQSGAKAKAPRSGAPAPKVKPSASAPRKTPVSPTVRSPRKPTKTDKRPGAPTGGVGSGPVGGGTSHGGGPFDINVSGGDANDIEPAYQPALTSLVYSSNRLGPDNYPNGDDGEILPFLVGPDYHLYVYPGNRIIRFGLNDAERGEQFEPNPSRDQRLAFSAFLPADASVYKPDSTTEAGLPVRIVAYATGAFAGSPTFTKILPPSIFHVETDDKGTPDDKSDDTTTPSFAPDATPQWLPNLPSRYIFYVSLRGYDAENPDTQYTSLWMWDTESDLSIPGPLTGANPRRVLSIPGRSILWPKFNRDGTQITFAVTDFQFAPDATGAPADPIFDFDVTKANLATNFKSRIFVADVLPPDPAAGRALYEIGEPQQASYWTDAEGNEPRDIMPFWTALNQLGFSSDRKDTDGDGLADTVITDPATALFDIYLYPFSYGPAFVTEQSETTTAHRQTLGDATADDSNELNGTSPTIVTTQSGANQLRPTIAYQADDAGNWDIWQTNKATPPVFNGNILVGLPVITGHTDLDPDPTTNAALLDNLKKTYRIGLPGDYVNISVQVNTQGGAPPDGHEVIVYVKDPDKHSFDELLHREVNSGIVPEPIYVESDSGQPVELTDEDAANYVAKYGDAAEPPQRGTSLILTADPLVPGRYTGKWYTPMQVSDYLIDVTVDGITADNVAGFSTAPFVPTAQTLLVSDFAAGQRSVGLTTQTLTTAGVPTESYFTWRPHATMGHQPTDPPGDEAQYQWKGIVSMPAGAIDPTWAVLGPRIEWQSVESLDVDPATGRTYALGTINDDLRGNPLFVASHYFNAYDLWRVQCREPITRALLDEYRPYTHAQPGYPVIAQQRTQQVADRSVFWIAPHAGQLNGNAGQNSTPGNGGVNNQGFGTVANVRTQGDLLYFLTPDTAGKRPGGRLLLGGDDVGFVLTQDGAVTNPLLTAMRTQYVDHFDRSALNPTTISARTILNRSLDGDRNGTNPIPYAVWELHHYQPGPDAEPEPTELTLAPFRARDISGITYHPTRPHDTFEDGAFTNLNIDSVIAIGATPDQAGAVQLIYNYGTVAAPPGPNQEVAGVQGEIPPAGTANTSNNKSLFFAFGLEGIHRHYYNNSKDNLIHSPNRPMELFHNAVDWMTTGAFAGQVFINNNVANVKDILVWAVDDYNARDIGKVKGTALTDEQGLYYMDGMDASQYRLFVYKTGYAAQNPTRSSIDSGNIVIHGGGVPFPSFGAPNFTEVNLFLVAVPAGTLRGVVTDQETGAPLPGVVVKIHDIQNTVNQQTTTDANGVYQFANIPAGLYVVNIDDGTTVGETVYGPYTNETNPVKVNSDLSPDNPNGDTLLDIKLAKRLIPPKPATVTVTVLDASSGTNAPAIGAMVTLTDLATGQPAVTDPAGENPGVTDENGQVVFHVIAGQFEVTAHYEAMIGGAPKVFKDQTQTITAQPDETTPGGTSVQFIFGGVLHTFPANTILMASAPYEYGGQTTGMPFNMVLGINDQNALKTAIVAFEAKTQSFTFYPTFPADTFHLGRGYGFKLPTDGKVFEQGTTASTTNGYYIVRSEIGWNLIANPFTTPVSWATAGTGGKNVKFALRDDPKQTLHNVDDASDTTTLSNILSPLWGPTSTDAQGNGVYSGSYTPAAPTMRPWQSYWVKVAQPTLFYFPRPTATVAAASLASRDSATLLRPAPSLLMPRADVWGVNITATSGDLSDTGLALGVGRNGTKGYDVGLDLAKPGPMSSGGPMLYTSFKHANGAVDATDVRGQGANGWAFNVATNLANQSVTLTWTANGALPSGATLVDTANGHRVNMGTTTEYTYRSASNGGDRVFRVEVR